MAKTCNSEGCSNPRFSNGFCNYHQHERTDEKWMKKMALQNSGSTSPKTVKRKSSSIPPVAPKRAKELAIYRPLRDKYMEENPVCECCDDKPSQDLHHKGGRMGVMVYYVPLFMACCHWCHKEIHAESAWSYEQGYLISK